MADAPSWLDTAGPAASGSASAPAADPLGSMNIESSAGNAAAATVVADDKDLPAMILFMRLLNMGAAGALIAISVRNMS